MPGVWPLLPPALLGSGADAMSGNESKAEAVARAVEAELDRDFDVWLERWTFEGGSYLDAPEPPMKRYKTSPKRIATAAIEAAERHDSEQAK